MSEPSKAPDHADAALQAARWDARLRSPDCSESERQAFATWLDQDPSHRRAFETHQARLELLRNASMSDPRLMAYRAQARAQLRRRTALRAAAAGLAVAVLGAGFGSYEILVAHASRNASHTVAEVAKTSVLQTSPGEHQATMLSDGSRLTLDTRTRVEVAYTRNSRRAYLKAGRAIFEVAHDPARPFTVDAGGHQVTAVGTAFEVQLNPDGMRVTMLKGKVAVDDSGAPAGRDGRFLVAGQRLIETQGEAPKVETVDAERAVGWKDGRIVFADTPLVEVVDELNRYSQTPIRIGDSGLEKLRIGGMFKTDDPQSFVQALTNYFPIREVSTQDETVLLSSRRGR